jgi:mannose/cellobiose epimerase-like protein (N-acyl-D-glucosamine 2-epimerase family)
MLVDHALARGFDPVRGQLFESGSAYGPPVDRSIQWWAQFEAWNAFFLMHELYGKETTRYWDAATKAWALTRDSLTDKEHPGVCPHMDERGEVHSPSKSHQWFVSLPHRPRAAPHRGPPSGQKARLPGHSRPTQEALAPAQASARS